MDDLYITSFRPEFPQLTNRDLETTRKVCTAVVNADFSLLMYHLSSSPTLSFSILTCRPPNSH